MHLCSVLKRQFHYSLLTNHYSLVSQELYQQHILDHYKRPRNFCEPGANAVCAKGSNPSCGDKLVFCIEYDEKFVTAATFKGSGCAISIAAASILTEKLQNMAIRDAQALTEQDVYAMLGVTVGVGREKCVLLAYRALQEALQQH